MAKLTVARKRCATCKVSKPASEFPKKKRSRDGLTAHCKPCTRLYWQNWDAANKQKAEVRLANGCKQCVTCREEKTLSEFAPYARSSDGLRQHCRICVTSSAARRKTSEAVKAQRREYQRRRRRDPQAQQKQLQAVKRWAAANRDAVLARKRLHRAIKTGRVARATCCQVRNCRWHGATHAHHFDYRYPLLVTWLCPAHHSRLHAGEHLDLVDGLLPLLATIPPTLKPGSPGRRAA